MIATTQRSNDLLRWHRQNRGWSQQRLADLLVDLGGSADGKLVGKWERGVVTPSPFYRERLCKLFEVTADDLGLVDVRSTDDMKRRKLLTVALQLAGSALIAPNAIDVDRLIHTLAQPAGMDAESLDHFEQLNDVCWQLSNGNNLGSVEQLLSTYLPAVVEFARRPSRHQRTAAEIASLGYQLSYVLASNREAYSAALAACEQARQQAQIAKNRDLEVIALVRRGVVFMYRNRPAQALQSYQEAVQYTGEITPLLRSRLYANLCEVQAKLGLEEEARQSISIAHEVFPSRPAYDPLAKYFHFGEAGLYLHEALALLDLHKIEDAEKTLERVDGLHPKIAISERSRLEFLNLQALVAQAKGDLEQFSLYLEASVTGAVKLGSDLRYTEAYEVFKIGRNRWGEESQVKALAGLFTK